MSRSALKGIQAAAGGASDPVYVDDVFSTNLWDGTGSAQTITNGVDLSGEGGLVWIKVREQTNNHVLYDTVRGTTKQLSSNNANAEQTRTNTLTAFNNNGYALGADSSYGTVNYNGNGGYVGWTFRKQPGFFDVVTWTGNGVSGRQIPHSLGSVPGMIMVKNLDLGSDWRVFHRSLGPTKNLLLNGTNAALTQTGMWNDTAPTSTVFTVGNDGGVNGNASTYNYVAYVFAHDAQDFGENSDEAIIKCDSYTGNGSSSGQTITLGFEPQWVLLKKTTGSSEAWIMHDHMRGIVSAGNDPQLQSDSTGAEWSGSTNIEVTPTGFKLTSSSAQYNENSQTYIYMAIRRPHKPASELTATDLFKPFIYTGNGGFGNGPVIDAPSSPQAIDLAFFKSRSLGRQWEVITRLTSDPWPNKSNTSSVAPDGLHFDSTAAEADVWSLATDNCNDIEVNQDSSSNLNVNGENYGAWRFSRAPGFFDVVVYKGTNSATTISHNLGVAPEMIWLKNRDATGDWQLYLNAGGAEYGYYGLNQKYVGLNTSLFQWNNTSPTNSVVSIASGLSNASYSYVMYLFASVSGISKIGTYTGTGSELTVNCGFSAGARFVLITRVDSSMGGGGESWFVFDTARGITASSSPYLPLNDTDAEASGSFVKPDSSGFKVTTESVVNTSGKTYVFYAIA